MKRIKLFMAWLLMFMMIFTVFPPQQVAWAANSHTSEEAGQWAKGKIGGTAKDWDGAYGVQCVDFISWYSKEFWGVDYAPQGHANAYSWNTMPSEWTRIQYSSGFTVKPGDIAVWTYCDGSSYGHVGVVTSADSSGMIIAEQWSSTGGAAAQSGKVQSRYFKYKDGKNTFYGVVRPTYSDTPTISIDTTISENSYIFRNGTVYLNASQDYDGGDVNSTTNNNTEAQKWNVKKSGNAYQIITQNSLSGRVLNVNTDGTSANGANVTLWAVTGHQTQLWQFEKAGDGYRIHPSDNLNVSLAVVSGDDVKLANNSDGGNQSWYMETPIPTPTPAPEPTIKNEILSLEDISTSIVLTEQNLYIVNSKNELLVCGVADKYADSKYLESRNLEILHTSFKKVMDGVAVASASCDSSHVFAIKLDGSLWGWGFNNVNPNTMKGMLGLGKEVECVDTPTKIMDNVVSVSTSNYHTLALKKDGSLWSWGTPGLGATSLVPSKIMDNVISAATGGAYSYDSLVIKEDNSLWVSGSYNVFPYNLSDGITLDAKKPEGLTRVMENVKYTVARLSSNYAVKQDGSLWSWGKDNTGELGNGGKYDQGPGGQSWAPIGAERIYTVYTYQRSPIKILNNVERVIPTVNGTYAFTTGGGLWMWGDSPVAQARLVNEKLQIFKPLELEKTVPRKCVEDFIYISTFGHSSVILKRDGSVWVKGDNEYGQLGTGDTTKVDNYTKILSGGVAGQPDFKVFETVPTVSPILIK